MGYRSEVFAAVGGNEAQLQKLIKLIGPFDIPEEQEIFSYFKLVQMEENYWMYAFYHSNIKWYAEAQNVWQEISKYAKMFDFSYTFYRIGDGCLDISSDQHCAENAKDFYHVLIDAVKVNRSIDLNKRLQSVFCKDKSLVFLSIPGRESISPREKNFSSFHVCF